MATSKSEPAATPVPDWMLGIVGLGAVAWLLYTLPILDILSVFFSFVVIPVIFLLCVVMGSMGTFNAISKSWNGGMDQIKDRVAKKMAA